MVSDPAEEEAMASKQKERSIASFDAEKVPTAKRAA